MTKTILAAIFAAAALHTLPALAADSGGKKSQTTRMSQCSTEAKEKGLKGDARKEHMSQCLRSSTSQIAKKECTTNATEKGLKGERRKEFVTECVKNKASTDNAG
jgi:hypothetical protein